MYKVFRAIENSIKDWVTDAEKYGVANLDLRVRANLPSYSSAKFTTSEIDTCMSLAKTYGVSNFIIDDFIAGTCCFQGNVRSENINMASGFTTVLNGLGYNAVIIAELTGPVTVEWRKP